MATITKKYLREIILEELQNLDKEITLTPEEEALYNSILPDIQTGDTNKITAAKQRLKANPNAGKVITKLNTEFPNTSKL